MKTRIKEIEQQLFNKAAIHLLKQNKKSVCYTPHKIGGSCMYRGSDGTMCAVGALIPNSRYCLEMEGRRPPALLMDFPNIIPELSNILDYDRMDFGRFLSDLQTVHDNHEPKYWEIRLRALASDYKLSFDEVEKFLEAK